MGDSTPAKDEPDAYTKGSVQAAIQRYELRTVGFRQAITYNSTDSVDGQWYVFIIDQDGFTVAHHNPDFRNRDPVRRVDASGYFYGDELLGASQDLRCQDYIFLNPDTSADYAEAYLDSAARRAAVHLGLLRRPCERVVHERVLESCLPDSAISRDNGVCHRQGSPPSTTVARFAAR